MVHTGASPGRGQPSLCSEHFAESRAIMSPGGRAGSEWDGELGRRRTLKAGEKVGLGNGKR